MSEYTLLNSITINYAGNLTEEEFADIFNCIDTAINKYIFKEKIQETKKFYYSLHSIMVDFYRAQDNYELSYAYLDYKLDIVIVYSNKKTLQYYKLTFTYANNNINMVANYVDKSYGKPFLIMVED